jgi:competence protein ComEC
MAMALATWMSALAALHSRATVALGVAAVALAGAVLSWHRVGRSGDPTARVAATDPRAGAARRTGWRSRCVLRAGAWSGIAVAVLIGVFCGSVATAARLAARDAAPVARAAADHAQVIVELTARRDPRRLDGQPGGSSWLVPAWLHRLETGSGPAGEPVRLRVRILVLARDPQWQPLLPGQRVRATGRLAPARGGDLTAAVLSAVGPPELLGRPSPVQRVAGSLRVGLQAAAAPLPDQPGGLLPGLAVGDVSGLEPAVEADFVTTGMTHLTAVSGSNVAIVVGFVVLIARAGRAPPGLTAAASGMALVGYVVLCRADPSVLRAAAMGLVALAALASGRPRAAMPALGATVSCLVVIDPELAGSIGFALSVLATGGLLLLAPPWRDGLRRRGVPAGVAEALVVPAAAQVAVAPVVAGVSGTVSLVAVVANLVATPAVAPATVLGVLAAAVSTVWPAAAELLAWLAGWPAWWLVLVARYGAGAPAAVVPWPAGVAGAVLLAGLTVALLVAARYRPVRRLVAVVVVAVVVGGLPVRFVASGWPPAGVVVVTCAVGQGDLVVIPVAAGAAVVVDAGPDPAAADRCLRDLGIGSVPVLVISHYHADHVGGVEGVFRDRAVAAVLTPGWPEPDPGHDLVATVAASASTPVEVARTGSTYQVAGTLLRVIGPRYELAGTRSDPNNNSLVIMAEVRGVRVLLTGDAEVELQQALTDRPGAERLRADVLKVAHHGSGYQEPDFLEAVDPAVAMVPVGADNPYGHPSPALLAQLQRDGARVLRTDTQGDLAVVRLDTGELAVVTRAPPAGSTGGRPGSAARDRVDPRRALCHARRRCVSSSAGGSPPGTGSSRCRSSP